MFTGRGVVPAVSCAVVLTCVALIAPTRTLGEPKEPRDADELAARIPETLAFAGRAGVNPAGRGGRFPFGAPFGPPGRHGEADVDIDDRHAAWAA